MMVSSIGSVGVPQFQGLPVAEPGPTARHGVEPEAVGSPTSGGTALPSPDSAMWGGSATSGSTALPSPDSAMWGGSAIRGSTALPSPDSAMWGGAPTPGSVNVMA